MSFYNKSDIFDQVGANLFEIENETCDATAGFESPADGGRNRW